jgi:hypothetical protein
MDQALLLIAINPIVCCKKITNQDTFEVFQHFLKEGTFTALFVQIGDVMQIRKDPNVGCGAPDAHLCLIDMKQISAYEMTKDGLVG